MNRAGRHRGIAKLPGFDPIPAQRLCAHLVLTCPSQFQSYRQMFLIRQSDDIEIDVVASNQLVQVY
jgi:hypothetical protein